MQADSKVAQLRASVAGAWLERHRSELWLVASVGALAVLAWFWWRTAATPWRDDSHAFWEAWRDGRLYPETWQPVSEYVYSPAFAQAFWPLTKLPFTIVNAVWAGAQLVALIWMLRPVGALAAVLFPWPNLNGITPVFGAIDNGNPMILTAAAITLGLTRWPWAFTFVLNTKVSAGIGLLWYAVRRQWRPLGGAVAVAAAVFVVSFAIAPHLWIDWFELLYGAAFHAGSPEAMAKERWLPVPLSVRGPIGLAIVLVASWRGVAWLVPLGCFLALPDIHLGGFAVLTAVPAVWWRTRRNGRIDLTGRGTRKEAEASAP